MIYFFIQIIICNIKSFWQFIIQNADNRLKFIQIFFLFISIFSIFGLFYRTFISPTIYNYNNRPLGNIYDRNNNLIACNDYVYDIILDTSKSVNIEESLQKLPNNLINKANIYQKYKDGQVKILIAKQISTQTCQALNITGIEFNVIKKIKRYYLLGKHFTTLGLYEPEKGITKGIETLVIKRSPNNIQLTIDIRIQNTLADFLENSKQESGAQECMGIIVNANCEVLGMHTTSSSDTIDIKDFYNNLMYGLFEFGSTIKAMTILCGFHYNKFEKDTLLDTEEGKIDFGVRKLTDCTKMNRYSSVEEILNHSSNLGTVAAVKKIGYIYIDFLKQIGLADRIDLEFTQTCKPQFRKEYKNTDFYVTSYGYCFLTSPFNVIRAFLSIFNGGYVINPTIILKQSKKPKIITNMRFSEHTINQIISCLQSTAAAHPSLKKLKCAAKSGTVYRFYNGCYDINRFNNYYICAVPDINGKIKYLILLILIDPQPALQGGIKIRNLCAKIAETIYIID